MGRLDGAHPVAHRLVDRVAERARAALDGADLGPHEPHVADVRRLAADVLGSHVDDAVEAEPGTGGGGGHAVLAGAGFGDDPPLAHPDREQALAERVVDLVGAGVAEVLALEADLAPPASSREPLGEEQRGGAADEGGEQAVEFGRERRVGHGLGIGALQLVERGGERLRHVAAAESAEPPVGVGHARQSGRRLLG